MSSPWNTITISNKLLNSGCAFGNGKYVVVSENGTTRLYSNNAISWTSFSINGNLKAVFFGNGLFVAVGDQKIYTSSDGVNWTFITAPISIWRSGCYFRGSYYVTTADNDVHPMICSTAGSSWSYVSYSFNKILRGVICGDTLAIAITSALDYFTTTDGTNWTPRTFPAGYTGILDIAYGNGYFVAVGDPSNVLQSSDGINWVPFPKPQNKRWNKIVFGSGIFCCSIQSNNQISVSYTNGSTWTIQGPFNYSERCLCYGNGYFVAPCYDANYIKIAQTAIFGPFTIASQNVGTPSCLITDPTSSQTGSFSYTSSNTDVATISGNTITIKNAGSSVITAKQGPNSTSLGGTTTTTFTVTLLTPTITDFTLPAKQYLDPPFTLTAPSSNSTGAFTYISSNTNVATISENIVTIVGAGSSDITAIQAATSYYASGSITSTLLVSTAVPTITNFIVPAKVYGNPSFNLSTPTSNSTGAFTYTSSDIHIATIFGNTVTIVGAGQCVITATQEATINFSSGSITSTFVVSTANPNITNFNVPAKVYGDSSFILTPPSSNSSGAFTYTSSRVDVATISGSTVTIVDVGETVITATQAATTNYTSGYITAPFIVQRQNTVLGSFAVNEQMNERTIFTLQPPSSNSDAPFVFSSSNLSVATISGNLVTVLSSGSSTITARQEANHYYTAAQTSDVLNVTKQPPVITNFSFADVYFNPAFTTTVPITAPSSTSPGSFTYSSLDESVATIDPGNNLLIHANFAGTGTIRASQAATTNYLSAYVDARFTVLPISPQLGSFSVPTTTFGEPPFLVTPPSSTSDGDFTYASSNTSIAEIGHNSGLLTQIAPGSTTILCVQQATRNYLSGQISAEYTIEESTPLNPTTIESSVDLAYFIRSAAPCGQITNSENILVSASTPTWTTPVVKTITNATLDDVLILKETNNDV